MMTYFKAYADSSAAIEMLSDAEAGRLYKALLRYINGAEVGNLSGQERIAFAMLAAQIDRDAVSSQEKAETARENGRKGGRPKTQRVLDENPKTKVVLDENPKTHNKDNKTIDNKTIDKDEEVNTTPTPPRARARENPFSADFDPASLEPDPIVTYAEKTLMGLSPNNVDELVSFRDTLPDDVIVYAIDQTTGNGVRAYNYVRAILNRYVRDGIKSVADAKAAEDKRKAGDKHGNDAKSAANDDADLWAGMSEEDIKLVEQLANDGHHWG